MLSPEVEVTKSLSSNLLKVGYTNLEDSEKRVIDTNGLIARRIEELAAKMSRPENAGFTEHVEDGFAAGLLAERVEGLLSDEESPDGIQGNVIKAQAENEVSEADARQTAEEILEQAKAQAQEEAEQILAQARETIAGEREDALAQAREQGYSEGRRQADEELAKEQEALASERKSMEAEYESLLGEVEPKLVDAITDVYEHVFQVELASDREILLHLISSAVRKIEGSRDFLVHVSGEDYPYVRMEKKQIEAAVASPSATIEFVEDITLKRNECMIETDGGIFDCGLGTQLTELKQKLKLLSYAAN